MSECPFIMPREQIVADCCKPVIYESTDGEEYQFWRHTTPDGDSYNVQHCQLKGRKRDVFECFNENEWRVCFAYRFKKKEPTEFASQGKGKGGEGE